MNPLRPPRPTSSRRWSAPTHLVFAWLLASSCDGGCKGKTAAPTPAPAAPAAIPALGEITIKDVTPEAERPAGTQVDLDALEAQARRALTEAGLFAPAPGDADVPVRARIRIEVGVEDVVAGDKAAARAMVRLRLDTRPSEVAAEHWHEDVQAGSETQYRPAAKPDRRELFQRLLSRTVADLIAGYVARQRLWTGDGSAARATLKADAGELRLEAFRVVAERRIASAVPELLALLEDPDESVRDAALGALVELRERRAVGVLAGQRSMRDKREMRKILDAISVLGGDEAAEYLGFVADGHDDPEIRAIATQARQRLQRRADAGAK